MPQVTHHPTAVGSLDEWTLGAGADKVVAVASNDGDTTLILVTNPGGSPRELYTMPDLPADATSVSNVAEHGVFRQTGAGTCNVYLNNTTFSSIGTPTGSYVDYSLNWTGPPFTPAQINAAESGVQGAANGATQYRCTEVYRVTDYASAAGGFFFFAGMLIPILGVVTLATFRKACEYLGRLGPHFPRFTEAEVLSMWEAWKGWGHRSYAFQKG